ncbi:DUF4351 domain-containing protein [Coleofasciculus sp. B1-GNL1-01]|uniref:DUF4351 domain-containing protein n=1 Tax=Coleofasciculus sp. B1-GNL1-01 TaxID=3068484 RepID=UPI0040633DFE
MSPRFPCCLCSPCFIVSTKLLKYFCQAALGEVNPGAIERVRALSIEELEELGVALLDFSGVADLIAWFDRQKMRDVEIALILRQLTRRLGDVDPSLRDRIHRLSTEQLEALGVALLDFFQVADLVAWLEEQQVLG